MTLTNDDLREMLGERPKKLAEAIDVREGYTKPFSNISIETGAACNRRCAFCPQSVNPRDDEFMPEEMFYKIIGDLVAMRYKQRIHFNSYNEPTRDKRLKGFMQFTRERLPRVWMMMNTNGDYLKSPEDIMSWFDHGLNAMQINIYSPADGSGDRAKIERGNANAEKRYHKIKEMVDSLPLDQEKGIYSHHGVSTQICHVVPKWDLQPEDVADHANTAPSVKHGTSVRNHITNRAGSIPGFVGELAEPMEKMCVRPFRSFMINWRGDAYLCCNDYYAEAVVGNVMERSLEDLWNDERFQAYRIKLQAKDRNILLCDKCDYTGGFYQHNVPFVTMGEEKDKEIIKADLRSKEAAGFGTSEGLVQLRRSK